MFEIMLAIALALGSAMPKNTVSNTNGSTIVTQDTGGDDGHFPPVTPPPIP
jgi:nucleoid-associated protein YgaU